MNNYTILNKSVNVSELNTEEEAPPEFNNQIRSIVYTKDGEELTIELPESNVESFIPLDDVTDDIIIGWIQEYESSQ